MQNHQDTIAAIMKAAVSWLLVALGKITSAEVATYLAIAYTGVQLYVTVRDKILRRRQDDEQLR